jgi:hypothetical protein
MESFAGKLKSMAGSEGYRCTGIQFAISMDGPSMSAHLGSAAEGNLDSLPLGIMLGA